MQTGMGHTLRQLQTSLGKRDYKAFAGFVKALFAFFKESDNPMQDCAATVGNTALKLYNNFTPLPIFEIYSYADKMFHPDFAQAIKAKLAPDLELFKAWRVKIDLLYKERLAREIRETIRSDDYEKALRDILQLLTISESDEGKTQNLDILGSILGSLVNDQERVDKVLHALDDVRKSHGLGREDIARIESVRRQRFQLVYKSSVENRELEWSRMQADTAREIKNLLPHANDLTTPTGEETAAFRRLFQALFNTPFEHGKEYRWTDVMLLLVELCPQDATITGALAGVETRIYMGLGKKARTMVSHVFKEFGQYPILTGAFLKYTQHIDDLRYEKYAIELMGALHAPVFINFLMEALKDKRFKSEHELIILALGNIGNPEIIKPLTLELKHTLGTRVIDPAVKRRAMAIIRGLGRVLYSSITSSDEKDQILDEIINNIPEDDRQLRVDATLELFSYPESPGMVALLQERHVKWVTVSLVDGLWLKDPTPSFAQGGDRQETILGFREKIAKTLIALGKPLLPYIVQAALHNIHHFSGAYMAIGEVLAEIGDESAVKLLEMMLINTFTIEDKNASGYDQEFYWDVAEGKRKPLMRSTIASSLIYALDKTRSEAGRDVLLKILRQIQAGQIAALGEESSKVLMDACMRISRERGTSIFVPSFTSDSSRDAERPAGASVETDMSTDELRRLVKSLKKSGGLFSSRDSVRKEKIVALQKLSHSHDPEGIDAIVQSLGDSDKLVREAATTAIYDLLSPMSHSTDAEKVCRSLVRVLEQSQSSLIQSGVGGILKKIDTSRPVLRKTLSEEMQKITRQEVRRFLHERCGLGGEGEKEISPVHTTQSASHVSREETDSGDTQSRHLDPGKFVDKLEIKRQYMIERKKWIEGGKKGAPPELPPNL